MKWPPDTLPPHSITTDKAKPIATGAQSPPFLTTFKITPKKIKVPTAIAEFPKEMSEWPPKSYIKRIFNLKRWTKMKRGGHFAALEQPDLLIKDIRAFARTLR